MELLPTPEQLLENLKDSITVPKFRFQSFAWRDLLDRMDRTEDVGEIRVLSDWSKLPRKPSTAIRFVVLRDKEGAVVRWATDDFLQRWGPSRDPTHEGLIGYLDDPPQEARRGYIYISVDGTVKVKE
jgi:hypothetical protein